MKTTIRNKREAKKNKAKPYYTMVETDVALLLAKLIHVKVNIKHLLSTWRSVCASRGLYTFDGGGQAGTSRLRVAELHVLNEGGKGLIRWMLVLLNEQMKTHLHLRHDHLHKHILRQQQLQRRQKNTH